MWSAEPGLPTIRSFKNKILRNRLLLNFRCAQDSTTATMYLIPERLSLDSFHADVRWTSSMRLHSSQLRRVVIHTCIDRDELYTS
jgi:hypothetical protein